MRVKPGANLDALLQPLLRRNDGRPPRRDRERREALPQFFTLLADRRVGRLRRVARLLADADRVLVAEPRRAVQPLLRLRRVAVGLGNSVRQSEAPSRMI